MQLSISDLLPFLDCEYKGITRYTSQRWLPPSSAMSVGTALHTYLDRLLSTGTPDHGFLDTLDPDIRGTVSPLLEAADRSLSPPPFNVDGTEVPLSITIAPGLDLVGRQDFISPEGDGEWSGQFKSVGRGANIGHFLERVRMSPHEITYRVGRRAQGKVVHGTRLVIFRTYLTKTQKEADTPIIDTFDLAVAPEEDEEAFLHIREACLRFGESILAPTRQPETAMRNYAACFSLLGPCPLMPHCHHHADVRDLLTQALENRYTDLPE